MKKLLLYGVPFAVDIIAGLVLFLGRHSLASQGFDESAIRTIIFGYGIGYTLSSLMMTRLVKAHLARLQMAIALVGISFISLALANTTSLLAIQVLYCLFPFMVSLFFNAYQIFMLNLSNKDARPLAATVGHYTFAWSMGFALGPFASGMLVSTFDWAQVYYLAALLAVGILAIILLYRTPPLTAKPGSFPAEVASPLLTSLTSPAAISTKPETLAPSTHLSGKPLASSSHSAVISPPSLVGPAWLGLLAGLAVWNTALIFWPVQSVQLGISPNFSRADGVFDDTNPGVYRPGIGASGRLAAKARLASRNGRFRGGRADRFRVVWRQHSFHLRRYLVRSLCRKYVQPGRISCHAR